MAATDDDTMREIATALSRHVDQKSLQQVINDLLDVPGEEAFVANGVDQAWDAVCVIEHAPESRCGEVRPALRAGNSQAVLHVLANLVAVQRAELFARLKLAMKESGFTFLLIRADERVPHGEVEYIMKVGKQLGMKRIAFATLPKMR